MIEKAPMTKHQLTFSEATMYCMTLAHDNKHDWRLPTVGEYMHMEEQCWFDMWYPVLDEFDMHPKSRLFALPVRDADD